MRQKQALGVMLGGGSVFLTGPPGAGKTYVLNEFIRRAERLGKKVAVTASTGIAATHIGGTTIHSWSGLGIRDQLSDWDRERLSATDRLIKRYNATDILVIDEVSMLHGQRLDMVNEVCKLLRKNSAPFGGLQVILVGDLFQLPPVSRGSERADFAHLSTAWAELQPQICYLSEQHRQVNDGLLDLLEAMRRGDVSEAHEARLAERLHQSAGDSPVAVTRLFAHNIDVDTINQRHLAALDTETKTYTMRTKGAAAKVEQLQKSVLAPEHLELKIDAEVMFVANNFAAGFVNGSRGRVVDFADGLPLIQLISNGRELKVEPHEWNLSEDGRIRAAVTQLPLRLAWAITIHKSQGMSLDAAEIDLSKSFTPGMGYVALSRVRSLDGVFLSGVNAMAMQLHPDIFAFDRQLQQASAALAEQAPDAADESQAVETNSSPDYNEELFTKLRKWRLERARTDQVAPFIVAHNSLLEAIATRLPATAQALLALPGCGAKKLETYGEDILKITAPYVTQSEEAQNLPTSNWSQAEDATLLSLFRAGTPLPEAAQILDRPTETLWQRLSELQV